MALKIFLMAVLVVGYVLAYQLGKFETKDDE